MANKNTLKQYRKRKNRQERKLLTEINRIEREYDLEGFWFCRKDSMEDCEFHVAGNQPMNIARTYIERMLHLNSDMRRAVKVPEPRLVWTFVDGFPSVDAPYSEGFRGYECLTILDHDDPQRHHEGYVNLHITDSFRSSKNELLIPKLSAHALDILVRSNISSLEKGLDDPHFCKFFNDHFQLVLNPKPKLLVGNLIDEKVN